MLQFLLFVLGLVMGTIARDCLERLDFEMIYYVSSSA